MSGDENDKKSIDLENNVVSNDESKPLLSNTNNRNYSSNNSSINNSNDGHDLDFSSPPSNHIIDTTATAITQPASTTTPSSAAAPPLDTLVDSNRFIIKHDSDVALNKVNQNNGTNDDDEHEQSHQSQSSPWILDHSPMLSMSLLTPMPDLDEMRESQVAKHKLAKKKKHEQLFQQQYKQQLMNKKEQFRNDNIDGADDEEENELNFLFIDNIENNHQNSTINHDNEILLFDEDEQWERKRKAKLRKVVQKSYSNLSLRSATSGKSGKSTTNSSIYSPTEDIIMELRKEFAKDRTPPSIAILYGIINLVIVLPVLLSFGSIIYHDDFFRPYMPVLVKLTVVSGVVHQFCVSTFSTLPFAIGQVQDAGLIFLSTIASGIVRYCQNEGKTDEEILATSVIGLSLFTACLGVGLVLIGRWKLASYVQMLPTPVVGGYLAFIGFFCGQGGLSLMANVQVSGILEWSKFFHYQELVWTLPGVVGGIFVYVMMRTLKHIAILPCAVAAGVTVFYVTLNVMGIQLDDAKEAGWISQADAPPVWYHTWDYFKFDKVVWAALPGQILTALSMIFVVALSSSLDIAAIDLEVPKPLEYNYELRMLGLSNLVSGLTGGYTGSYIFSQTVFSLRAGIRSELMGYVVALGEAVTVVVPFSIISYVPNFVFGSLLVMICVDLMVEWLWDVRKKMTKAEYAVALATFVFIQLSSVEYGIISGTALYFILLRLGFEVTTKQDCSTRVTDEPSSNSTVKSNCDDVDVVVLKALGSEDYVEKDICTYQTSPLMI